MSEFSLEDLSNLKEGLELYDQHEYWECHEVLEDYWLVLRGDPLCYIFWAVIQVAAALHHYQRSNLVGAKSLIKKSKEKLNKCDELKSENDILKQRVPWDKFKKMVFDVPEDPNLEDFKHLYEFSFLK